MTDPTNVHEPVPQSAKLTAREKKWIIYDVGNSAFVLLSTAVIPIYAKSLMPADGNIVSAWGYAQTIASLVIALLMPLLGSIADVQGMKIKFFLGFFGTGVVTCCAMALPLTWLPFLVVYILATIGLNGSLTFYDSMLIDATSNERMDKVSSHGYGWGYIGSTVPFIFCIALIFGGAFALIMGAITPAGGNIKLNQLINTPKEFQGKEFNILVTGVDRSSTGDLSAGAANDSNVNDGMTDMILYVHFNNETGEMKMLQIPRDTMVTTDTSVSGNFRINGVAKTQGSDSNNNMAALCELVADQYKLPIDGFITIRLEMLTELVDLFGGVEINVPVDVDYAALGLGDSVIHAGYQTLNGASMEFLLRARKIYPDGDIGRLNMQRQFYAALFRKLKSIGNIWDVAKLTPAVLNYMETNLSASDLISFAISMLKIDSSKIMICQMPVISGPQYNGQSLLYPARQADADLLNQYFRENTGPVDASQLNLCDNVIDLSGYTATDPKIQQMGGLMAEADDAQKNDNLDGSNQVTDIMASESTAESESTDTDSTDTESQPAA